MTQSNDPIAQIPVAAPPGPAAPDVVGQPWHTFAADTHMRKGWAAGLADSGQAVWSSRSFIWQLFRRDFLTNYRKSFFGIAWLLLSPLMASLAWMVMNHAGVLAPGELPIPYPAFILIGTTLWGLFMSAYSATAGTLSSAQSFILQVNCPHEAILIKQMLQQYVGFLLGYFTNVTLLLIFGIRLSPIGILVSPLVALPILLLGSALGVGVGVIGVVAFEVRKFADAGLGMAFFLTPVLYAPGARGRPLLDRIIQWNPLSHLITVTRETLTLGAGAPMPEGVPAYFAAALFATVLFVVAWRLFSVSEHLIVERLA